MSHSLSNVGAPSRAPVEDHASADEFRSRFPDVVGEYLAAKSAYERAWTRLLETHALEFGLVGEVRA